MKHKIMALDGAGARQTRRRHAGEIDAYSAARAPAAIPAVTIAPARRPSWRRSPPAPRRRSRAKLVPSRASASARSARGAKRAGPRKRGPHRRPALERAPSSSEGPRARRTTGAWPGGATRCSSTFKSAITSTPSRARPRSMPKEGSKLARRSTARTGMPSTADPRFVLGSRSTAIGRGPWMS